MPTPISGCSAPAPLCSSRKILRRSRRPATVVVVAGTTYVLDVHDCANGCAGMQGVAGDYNLTVTIN